jgi:hypothetical protein
MLEVEAPGGLWGFLLNKPDFSRAAAEERPQVIFFCSTMRDSRSITVRTKYSSSQPAPLERDGQNISATSAEQPALAQRASDAARLSKRLKRDAPAASHHSNHDRQITSETISCEPRASIVARSAPRFRLNFAGRLSRRDFSNNV